MSSTDRQNGLLLAEDWKKIYQSFKNAEFKSYDFDTLRRTMIAYIRENYPEDFNDYIESSEYLALIDLIAFLGQNLSFRIDLNARENFIELAERRESILRLARLLAYNPKRNRPANGLLKIEAVSTSENIVDSNGFNVKGRTVLWNDTTNENWYEQFIKIINAALPSSNTFGKPVNSQVVANIPTEQYRFNSTLQTVPVFTFSKTINNLNTVFEIVSTAVSGGVIYEESPVTGQQVSFIYRDNGQGPSSSNTGFFMHFRQGSMQRSDFSIDFPVPNQRVNIDTDNINQSDIWLYRLDNQNSETELWTRVDAVEGNNVIYNSLNKKIRNVYNVLTRENDRVSLIFTDGVFGNLPQGNFRLYYRTSNNRNFAISPNEIRNVSIRIPYISRSGRNEIITLYLDLKTSVNNASASETDAEIKSRAPSTYYTQNRLITGEDYNIGPLGVSQDILKVKSINRTASGISRYYDIVDPTGKYSKTNHFSDDGVIYEEDLENQLEFTFNTFTDVNFVVENTISPLLSDIKVRDFYLKKYPSIDVMTSADIKWNATSNNTNISTGVFENSAKLPYQVGSFTSSILKFIETGAMVKFVPPAGYYFNANSQLVAGTPSKIEDRMYLWTKVVSVSGDGTTVSNSVGPVVLNDEIPTGAVLSKIKQKFSINLSSSIKTRIADQIFSYKIFGLRYDRTTRQWSIITESNLNVKDQFSLLNEGDKTNQKLDSSWVILFSTNGEKYTVTYRGYRYVFESEKQVRFYYDSVTRTFNNRTGRIIKDSIKVLNINSIPNGTTPFTQDYDWEVVSEFTNDLGYINNNKIQISFFDNDSDGIIDDPDLFENIVGTNSLVFFKKSDSDGIENYKYVNQTDENIFVVNSQREINVSLYNSGDIFYIKNTNVFRKLTKNPTRLTMIYDYKARNGRGGLKFQYIHSSDENNRIDPSSTNIIDLYLLTKQYDTQFRQYLNGAVIAKPEAPTPDYLFRTYGNEINKIKSISDEVIYHPVRYKILFGNKSDPNLQATFKVIKNSDRVVNDNEIKSKIVQYINEFFSLDNWDFGDTFYFSELSAYIMKQMSPDITSIVIVPKQASQSFGSMFELKCSSDEIFISSAGVDDIEIISGITADRLRTTGNIITTTEPTSDLGGTVI
jgi:hypothetical protein